MATSRFNRTRTKTARARGLRRSATVWEQKLWAVLRSGRMGASFRRQHPVGTYYADFYCAKAKLAIELDGDQHGISEALAYDAARDRFLRERNLFVLRIPNNALKEDFDRVCEYLYAVVQQRLKTPSRNASRSDLPLSGGGKVM
jgi:very-short-patch-repair endonuclease